jgi:hypothetical protein
MSKKRINIYPNPKNVLIKVTQQEWSELFSIWVTKKDGTRVQLFTDQEEGAGYERRARQNVSVGTIVSAGHKVSGVLKGDVAVIDYLVTGQDDALVGIHGGNRLVSIPAHTTYHTEDSAPMIDGRKTYVAGDFDYLSTLLGVVRMGKLMAFHPYVFLEYENPEKLAVENTGMMKVVKDDVCIRKVLSAHPDSGYFEGNKVLVKEADFVSRWIDKKEISVVFEQDILGVL